MKTVDLQPARNIRVSIAIIMLFQVSALFVRYFCERQMVGASVPQPVAKYSSALFGFVLLGLLMTPILRSVWPPLQRLFRRPDSWLRMAIPAVLFGTLLWLANALILLALATLDWIDLVDQAGSASPVYEFSCNNASVMYWSIPIMALCTPIIEETLNRGLIMHSVISKGRLYAILISSLLFMALHKPESYAAAFCFGVISAVQMLNWQTLWGPIITHGTFNCLAEIDRTCINGRWDPGRLDWAFGGAPQTITLLLLLCVIIAIWLATLKRPGST